MDLPVKMEDQFPEKVVYEAQLNHLQEQLLEAMIEQQNTAAELKKFKEERGIITLEAKIKEQEKTIKQLSQKVLLRKEHSSPAIVRKIRSKIKRSPDRDVASDDEGISIHKSMVEGRDHHSTATNLRCVDSEWEYMSVDEVDVATEVTSDADVFHTSQEALSAGRWPERLYLYWWHSLSSFLAEFTPQSEEITESIDEGDQLSVRMLKKNIGRLTLKTKPILEYVGHISDILSWKSPMLTTLMFLLYMYSVWKGWLLSVVLAYCTLQLTLNYINRKPYVARGGLNDDSDSEEDDANDDDNPEKEKSQKYTARFQVVLQVARKVQNFVGLVANNLEKLDSLLNWQDPEITRYFYIRLCSFLVFSLLLPNSMIFTAIGLVMGIKMFFMNYIYNRYPRVKEKYDATRRLWKKLPTDADLEYRETVDKYILPQNPMELKTEAKIQRSELSYDNMTFCDLFNLPATEHPLSSWVNGRRATLIDKDKSLMSNLGKQGKLYLTRSFLCFERTQDKDEASEKNLLIPLSDVVRLAKAKPYSWFPGHGMSIEVQVKNRDKPYMFGAMTHRDETYNSIMRAGHLWSLAWAQAEEHPQENEEKVKSKDGSGKKSK